MGHQARFDLAYLLYIIDRKVIDFIKDKCMFDCYGICMYLCNCFVCIAIFCISLARKNGLGRLPEYND